MNLITPGREADEEDISQVAEIGTELAEKLISALGSKSNIKNVDACITRLRVTLYDINQADVDAIKKLGAREVLVIGDNLQAIFGTKSDNIKTEINQVLVAN